MSPIVKRINDSRTVVPISFVFLVSLRLLYICSTQRKTDFQTQQHPRYQKNYNAYGLMFSIHVKRHRIAFISVHIFQNGSTKFHLKLSCIVR